jgi:L-ascorbate metabolism protein UlaG (beta-lactamase superfamily)
MQLTKLTHSCVRVDTGAGVLVLDPGAYSEAAQALEGAAACLVTHLHADHLDAAAVAAALRAQPNLRVWAPASALDVLREALGDFPASDRLTAVGPQERFDVLGTSVQTYGGQHALNHSSIPVVANVGYLIGGRLYHPGDSFAVPPADVDTLLVPTHAPWSKTGEVMDFVIAVRPRQVFQVHDALLNERGTGLIESHVAGVADRYAATFTHLEPGDSREL